jgi:hypothetical protein
VCVHFEVRRVALNPLSESKLTTPRRKQWMQPSKLGLEHLQKSTFLATSIIRIISCRKFEAVELYCSKIS